MVQYLLQDFAEFQNNSVSVKVVPRVVVESKVVLSPEVVARMVVSTKSVQRVVLSAEVLFLSHYGFKSRQHVRHRYSKDCSISCHYMCGCL